LLQMFVNLVILLLTVIDPSSPRLFSLWT
jgi:hypothetical protein